LLDLLLPEKKNKNNKFDNAVGVTAHDRGAKSLTKFTIGKQTIEDQLPEDCVDQPSKNVSLAESDQFVPLNYQSMLSKTGSIRGNMVYGNDSIDYNISVRKTSSSKGTSKAANKTEMNTLSQSIRNLTIDNSVNAVRAWSEIQEKIATSTAAVSQVSERKHKNARRSSSGEESDDLDKFLTNLKNSRKPSKKVQSAEEEFIVPDNELEEDSSSGRTSPELSLRDRILQKSVNKTRTDVGTKPKERKPSVRKPGAKKNKPVIECDNSGSESPRIVPRTKSRSIVISSDESSDHELTAPPTKAFKTPRKPALDDSEDGFPSPNNVKLRKKKKPMRRNVIKSDSESRSSTPAGTSSTGTPADVGSEDSVSSEPEPEPSPPPRKPAAGDFKTPKSRKKGLREAEEVIGTPTSLTFLSSLTIDTPKYRCHPDALQYVSNFKKKKEELAKRLYHLYNKQIFDGILPADMEITWNVRLTKTAGLCYSRRYKNKFGIETRSSRIELSSKVLDSGDRLRDTLIHEMCHAASWIISGYRDGHGPLWRTWAEKAMQRFPELPVIDRCHSYQIRTKYNYVCVSCNYTIGRHSKSLDTEKKVCGHCHGRFKLVVNATNVSSAKPNSNKAPATPKAPNAFALFVKENYKTHKKPGVAHKDVMVALSTEFAKFKLQK